jgi:hypothetical protein
VTSIIMTQLSGAVNWVCELAEQVRFSELGLASWVCE